MSDSNPLVERVDALLKRHQQQAAAAQAARLAEMAQSTAPASPQNEALALAAEPVAAQPAVSDEDIPVLTEVVDPDALTGTGGPVRTGELDAAALESILAQLDGALQSRLNRTIGEVVEQAMDGLRADLSAHVRQLVRDAVADALAKGLPERPRSP